MTIEGRFDDGVAASEPSERMWRVKDTTTTVNKWSVLLQSNKRKAKREIRSVEEMLHDSLAYGEKPRDDVKATHLGQRIS
mgnify:CR=1 FL=1